MQAKTKHSLLQVILIALVIAIAYYVFSDPAGSTATENKQATQAPDTQPEAIARPLVNTAESVDGATETVDLEPNRSTSKRIRTVPTASVKSYKADELDTKTEPNWANEYDAQTTLESALTGDIDDAIAVTEIVEQCRAGYDNEKVVQNQLNRMSQTAKQGKALPGLFMPGTGSTRQFNNYAEYETYVWDRFAKCQTSRSMFDKGLRERLAQMAEAGNVNARYLYAMWIPTQSGASVENMVDWMNYQSLAMEYTWLNIRQGEPLGMLAYGRSLEQSGHIYFTPRHLRYGPAFILAAHKCGLDNSTVNQKVDNLTGGWKQRNQVQLVKQAESMSDMIVRTFCH
jgi:hypothetical protein